MNEVESVEERMRRIASLGGKAAHESGNAHEWTAEEAAIAGRLGGQKVAQDREHMSAIGKRGGAVTSANREHMREIGRRGGMAMSRDREHMARIGRKGGQARGKTIVLTDLGKEAADESVGES